MSKPSAIIIGAGPAGLSAAYRLVQQGYDVTVFEASPHIGGLSRSLKLWGQTVDLGPHRFFSADDRVNGFWREVIGEEFTWVNRSTRIYYRGRFFNYPLEAWNAFSKLGIRDVTACLWSYFAQKFKPSRGDTLEDWVVSRFGRKLFDIFFRSYTEKVWGIRCHEIDADWAAQRIKKFSLWEAVRGVFRKSARSSHSTLVSRFAYPKGGTGRVYEKLAEKIGDLGGKIRLMSPVKEVLTENTGDGRRAVGVRLHDDEEVCTDIVISTMPLTQMVRSLGKVPEPIQTACDSLKYRNTILVYLELDSDRLFPDNWLYIHSSEVQHGRITNFRNWCPSLNGGHKTTILCMEYWCFDQDPAWAQSDASLSELAVSELGKIGILPAGIKCLNTSVVKLRRSYPVYQVGYLRHLSVIQRYVDETKNLLAIGRYGAFKYNNQDHSILMGILAADECIQQTFRNRWEVNADSDYQEGAIQEAV